MDKKLLKKLIAASYIQDNLDIKKIEKIASLLKRKELKAYIKALKQKEKQKTVFISVPFIQKEQDQKTFQSLFPEKKIVYTVDQSLLLGIKIVNNDNIYEMSLKNRLETILTNIQHSYDR